MAPEVISLLSSPSGPPQTVLGHFKPTQAAAEKPQAPSRALDFDDDEFLDIENIVSSGMSQIVPTSAQPIGLPKQRGSDTARRENEGDFLFLSDEFDTTGDLSFNVPKRTQKSPVYSKNKGQIGRSLARAVSGSSGPKPSTALQPAGLKRWNSIADPIEYSSSPMGLPKEKDPFASSSPKSPVKRQPQHNRPPGQKPDDPEKPTRKPRDVFDLTSEPESSPPPLLAKTSRNTASWDPISSSMPEASTARDNPFASSPPQPQKRKAHVVELDNDSDVSQNPSDDEFPELSAMDIRKIKADLQARLSDRSPRHLKRSKTEPAKSNAKRQPLKTTEEKELEKKQKADARDAEKERKRLEKEREKQERVIQKEKEKALAEVNKVRTDKKVSTIEMIVDLPVSLKPGTGVQVRTLLEDLKVQHATWNSPLDNVVKWRRKVDKRFNEDLDYWEPIPARLESEKHVLVAIEAAEFVKLATGSEGIDIEAHVLKMKVAFPSNTLIYLIEGLDVWFRKNRTARNRQFQSAARNDAAQSTEQPRRRAAAHEIIDEDTVEDAIMSLQVDHGVLIHKTNAPVETAQWITTFTQHISTIPYRKARDDISASAGFCMDTGQVRTGDTVRETYIRMLQEVARVTAPMAYGIAVQYPTVSELLRGFEQNGPLALENCRKTANADGRLTDQRVGQAVSKRLYKIFTEQDPTSTDI
ncbi:uncharacterized protein JN550_011297 [Neoarthrinium moseri]|uniref:uncharacterized protein n=1 Tax=Neoarthrinium moseri TaxID=1658444 RepID=UPI001FDB7967|nr:uncharacterized protein JN550_011297 [Neoarthrinium moseri]KAI1860835.1 hypothetical protein JN550_011297 [Neoarthrinium moseri]